MKKQLLSTLLAMSLIAPNVVSAASREITLDALNGKTISVNNSLEEERDARIIIILDDGNKYLNEKVLSTSEGKELRMEHTKKFITKLKRDLELESIKYEPISEYNYILCGLTIKTNIKNLNNIMTLPNVKYAYESTEYKLDDDVEMRKYDLSTTTMSKDSNELVGIVHDENTHRGEGMVVSVIDSGIDVNHPVLRVSHPENGKYPTEQSMNDKIKELGIENGKWYNNKVVYAKNYEQKNRPDNIKERKEDSHGMHVSGIAVGNPESAESFIGKSGENIQERIVGVAPEAQLIFMRVFGENGGTNSDIYISAIEDSVKLGADSINMSLGSPNGTSDSVDQGTIDAINHAKAAGCVVAIAAGNDAYFGEGKGKPLADNPDYGTLGTPSVAEDSLSVASVNTTIERRNLIELSGINERVKSSEIYPGFGGQTFNEEGQPAIEYDYVFVNLGKPEDFSEDLTGKIALIERGEITFASKVLNAQAKNAKGVIIFNKDGDESVIGMDFGADKVNISIPVVSIGHSDGVKAKEAVTKKVKIIDGKIALNNPVGAEMSDFSSYGISTDGVFKPDITAPGGAIYSSINNNKYISMNGTSMATPHVAGAIPIVRKSLKERYPELKGEVEYNTIKAILMSTAIPLKEGKFDGNIDSIKHIDVDNDELVTPRKQGAGLMDVSKAISSDLYLTDENNKPSIWLGNTDGHLKIIVKIHNIGNSEKRLKYDSILQTDAVEGNRFALRSRKLKVVKGSEIKVPAKGEELITIDIDATEFDPVLIKEMKNGYFLEGFVLFKDAEDGVDTLSIPFSSFKGDWANLPVWEKPVYDHELGEEYCYTDSDKLMESAMGLSKTFDATALYSHVRDELGVENEKINGFDMNNFSFDKTKIAFSPISTEGYRDLSFRAVFIRNARNLRLRIENKDNPEECVDISDVVPEYRKNSNTHNPQIRLSEAPFLFKWDKNKPAGFKEGRYKYTVFAKSTAPDAKDQKLEFDVTLDMTAPKIKPGKIEVRPNAKKDYYIPNISEDFSGLRDVSVQVHYPDDRQIYLYDDDKDGKYDLPKNTPKEYIVVTAEDMAGNKTYFTEDESTKINATIRFLDENKKIFNDKNQEINVTLENMEYPDKKLIPEKMDDGTYDIYLPAMEAYYIKFTLPKGYKVNGKEGSLYKALIGVMDLGKTIDFILEKVIRNVKISVNIDIPKELKVEFIDKKNPSEIIVAEVGDSGKIETNLKVGKYVMRVTVPEGYRPIKEKEIIIDGKDIQENIVLNKMESSEDGNTIIPKPVPVPRPEIERSDSNIVKINYSERSSYTEKMVSNNIVENKKSSNDETSMLVKEKINKLLKKPDNIPSSNMKDIKNHWAEKAVDTVVAMNLFKGIGKETFGPDIKINNAMFSTLLYRMVNSPKVDKDIVVYGLNENSYYKDAVKYLKYKNILKISGVFDPNRELSREEIAEILVRFIEAHNLKFDYELNKVDDINGLSIESQNAINKILSYGVMKGKGNRKFDPKAKLTRAEVAQILLNFIEKAK